MAYKFFTGPLYNATGSLSASVALSSSIGFFDDLYGDGSALTGVTSTTMTTTGTDTDATYYPIFADTPGGASGETLRIHSTVAINPADGQVTAKILSGSGTVHGTAVTMGGGDLTGVASVSGSGLLEITAITIGGAALSGASGTNLTGHAMAVTGLSTLSASATITGNKVVGSNISGSGELFATKFDLGGGALSSSSGTNLTAHAMAVTGLSTLSASATLTSTKASVSELLGISNALSIGDSQTDIAFEGIPNFEVGYQRTYKHTGSVGGGALADNCVVINDGDGFILIDNGSTDVHVELPFIASTGVDRADRGWADGRVVTIKRGANMTGDVLISGAMGAAPGLGFLDDEYALISLDSAGASVSLIASGSAASNVAAKWLIF